MAGTGSPKTRNNCVLKMVAGRASDNDPRHWSWGPFLAERLSAGTVPGFAVHQTLYNFRRDRGIALKRNAFILEKFDQLYTTILGRSGRKHGE